MKFLKNKKELMLNIKSKKMYLFDFDGTLADTETLHWKAYNMCLEEYNIVLSNKNIKRYIGNQETKIYKMIKSDYDISFDDEVFFKKRISFYLELVKSQKLKPFSYVFDLLECEGVEFNILSSNRLEVLEAVLDIWDIRDKFNLVISAATNNIDKDTVLNNTYDYYGYKKGDVALFEDSNKYLKVGMANNILSIGIEHYYNSNSLTNCDYLWSTL
jgi:beta-phosphoglucomutase-like phosphatase (HAD superfamily)